MASSLLACYLYINKQKLFDLLLQMMPRKHDSKGVALLKSVSIRKYHEFVDSIYNSIPRVTAWHHEALQNDAKQ